MNSLGVGQQQLVEIAAGISRRCRVLILDEPTAALTRPEVERLFDQNQHLALTEASQRRLFFEQQIAGERDALATAEVAFKNTQQTTGLIVPAGQAEGLVRSGLLLRTEVAKREVQLQALRSYATEENPEVRVLEVAVVGLPHPSSANEEPRARCQAMMTARRMARATAKPTSHQTAA